MNLCVLASLLVGMGDTFSPASLSSRRKFPESSGHVHVTYLFQLRPLRVEFKGEDSGVEQNLGSCILHPVYVILGKQFPISETQFP